jgi:hypothetical protein
MVREIGGPLVDVGSPLKFALGKGQNSRLVLPNQRAGRRAACRLKSKLGFRYAVTKVIAELHKRIQAIAGWPEDEQISANFEPGR